MAFWPKHPPMSEPQVSPELKARLDALDERARLQEKGLKELEMDWQEWYDKFRLLFGRLSKRISDAAKAEENGSQSRQDAPGATNSRLPTSHASPHDRAAPSIPRRNY